MVNIDLYMFLFLLFKYVDVPHKATHMNKQKVTTSSNLNFT